MFKYFKNLMNILTEMKQLLEDIKLKENPVSTIGAENNIPVPGPDEELRTVRRSSNPNNPTYYLVKKKNKQ